MDIVLKDISKLKDYEKNARVHSPEQIKQIMHSVSIFGFNDPIEISENNVIISGHARVAAAKALGLTQVPTIVHSHLNEENRIAYALAANKIALGSSWDVDILKNELESLKDIDFDLKLTGFNDDELSNLFFEEVNGLVDDDSCPEIPEEAVTCLGEVWTLGNHRLLCGDSTVATDVERLLNGELPNTMITDPPYGVKLDMSWRDKANKDGAKNNKNVIQNDDRADWYDAYVLFPGNIAYVWHASRFTDVVMENLRDAGFDVKQQIIWNKGNFIFGRSNYHWKHEPCWYAVKKGAVSNWKGDRKQTTVWDCASPNRSISGSKDDKTAHPTQKPVELFERSIAHHTNPGEYVYDPFAGSGTIMIAAEKTQRRALMMELDPKYATMLIKRYEIFTGKKAVKG
jgi:DNA modification methylase